MDVFPFIIEMLSERVLCDFLSDVPPSSFMVSDISKQIIITVGDLTKAQRFMKTELFKLLPWDKKKVLIEGLPIIFYKLGNFMSKLVGFASTKQSSSSGSLDLVKDFNEVYDLINSFLRTCYGFRQTSDVKRLLYDELYLVKKNINNIMRIENMLLETMDSSTCKRPYFSLLMTKAFPALHEVKDFVERFRFSVNLSNELAHLPHEICKACDEQPPLAVVLIGSLLSIKPMANDTWNSVKNDLVKIKEANNHVMGNHMEHILTYCYDDLPYFLKPCFLYFACYPIGYEIPVTSLTEKWITEGFITPEK